MMFWGSAVEQLYRIVLGLTCYTRDLAALSWAEIAKNYPGKALPQVERLRDWQLIIFTGPPGTEKTFAIRSPAMEWRHWCFDPDRVFGDGELLMELLLSRPHEGAGALELARHGERGRSHELRR